MNLLSVKVLGIFIQICFITSDRIRENENNNFFDGLPSSENNLREVVASTNNDANQVDSQVTDLNSAIDTAPSNEVKDDEQTKIPMTCVSDYPHYCKSKFNGLRFNDGCHECRCKKSTIDFCEKGPCRYYARSFEHAVTYCIDIIKMNQKSYERQLKKHLVKKINSQKKINESLIIKKNIDSLPSETGRNLIDLKIPRNVSKQITTLNFIPYNEVKNVTERRTIKDSVTPETQKTVNQKSKPIKNSLPIHSTKTTKNTTAPMKLTNKRFSYKNSKNVSDIAKPMKSNRKKYSEKQIIRSLIVLLAENEMTILKILSMTPLDTEDKKKIKMYTNRVKEIRELNTAIKTNVLEVVKTKLLISKSRHGPYPHKFEPKFFVRSLKTLIQLKEELHEMTGGVKMWLSMLKKSYNAKKVNKNSGSKLKTYVLIVMFFVLLTRF